jgi:hypothetical protein
VTTVVVTNAAEPDDEQLARRIRQAAVGCTLHAHGPVNALCALLEAHMDGSVDGVEVIDTVIHRAEAARAKATDDAVARQREDKIIAVLTVFRRGLA